MTLVSVSLSHSLMISQGRDTIYLSWMISQKELHVQTEFHSETCVRVCRSFSIRIIESLNNPFFYRTHSPTYLDLICCLELSSSICSD